MNNEKQMKLFLGIFFAVTQAPNNYGIKRAFDVFSDGLIPDPDLGLYLNTGTSKSCFLILHMLP